MGQLLKRRVEMLEQQVPAGSAEIILVVDWDGPARWCNVAGEIVPPPARFVPEKIVVNWGEPPPTVENSRK